MNLILNVNTNLHSVQGSQDGELKTHAAIAEAIDDIKSQAKANQERIKKGLAPLPYKAIVKDEYGKDLVVIKETKSLVEIRNEYQKKQEGYSYENRENNLLLAMNEIGNSPKSEPEFKEELNRTLNSALFVTSANLTPGLERILDYFGDPQGLFNTINFKEDISAKCIKDLIDMPDPKTGNPPKSFEHLMRNIVSINEIFKRNENKEKYIETARNYINLRYKKYIPEEYRFNFETRGGLSDLIQTFAAKKNSQQKIENLEFEVSEKNFKKYFQSFSRLEQFRNKPVVLTKYLYQRVPEENRKAFDMWMNSIGCKDAVSTVSILSKWAEEPEEKTPGKNKRMNEKEPNIRGN